MGDNDVDIDVFTPALVCAAAAYGKMDKLKELIDATPDLVNCADYDERTPLHVACSLGQKEVVELLIAKGASVNAEDKWGASPLQDAAAGNNDEIVAMLKGKGAVFANTDDLSTTLCRAAAAGDLALMRRMITSGASVNQGDYDLRTPLHLAAAEGKLAAVDLLLREGAEVNAQDRFGGNPLLDALQHKNDAIVELLKGRGAELQKTAQLGLSVLDAASKGDIITIKRLVAGGAAVDAGDYDKRTALHLAASEGHLDIVCYLLSLGANINAADRWGGTPLGDAARHNRKDVVEMLQSKGADPGTNTTEFEEKTKRLEKRGSIQEPTDSVEDLKKEDAAKIAKKIEEASAYPNFLMRAINAVSDVMAEDMSHAAHKTYAAAGCIEVIAGVFDEYTIHAGIVKACCKAMKAFGEVDEFAPKIAQAGAIRLLVDSTKDPYDLETKTIATNALSNVTFRSAHHKEKIANLICRDNAFKAVIGNIHAHPSETSLLEKSVLLLWNCAGLDKSHARRIFKESGLVAIFNVWNNTRNEKLVYTCAGAILALMTKNAKAKSTFWDGMRGANRALDEVKTHLASPTVVSACTSLVAAGAQFPKDKPPKRKMISIVGGRDRIPLVVSAMRKHPDILQIQENCALIIYTAVRQTDSPEALLRQLKKSKGKAALKFAGKQFGDSLVIQTCLKELAEVERNCVIC